METCRGHACLGFLRLDYIHPKTGTGHPKQLKGGHNNQWSRRISQKHRLIYEIRDTEVIVIVISAYGYYSDK